MRKQLKLFIIIALILGGVIILDTIQAIIFNQSTFIKYRKKLENKSFVDKGILLDAFYCQNEEDVARIHLKPKLAKFSCQNENLAIMNELNTFIKKLLYSNFEYEYDINIKDYRYIYSGIKYDNLYRGKYKNLDTEIKYQIEDDKCYDLNTKDEIFNVHNNVNIGFINLSYLSEIIKSDKTKCLKNGLEYKCNALNNEKDIELNFYIENDNIEKINIADNNDFNYIMQYKNLNNVENITRLNNNYFNFGLFFNETNEIINKNIEGIGTFTYYYVSRVKFTPVNKRVELNETNLDQFLKNASRKIEKYNSTKYIFKDNLIIYISESYQEEKHVYISLEKYNNIILNELY